MINPWPQLPRERPYILEMDRECIDKFNASRHGAKESRTIVSDSLPEPFIGNPSLARIVLLGLNPGHSPFDAEAHLNEDFRNTMLRNLHHEPQECPFYPLNPKFDWTPTAKWWCPRIKKLLDATGLSDEQFAERLLVIEWFPYHSQRSGLPINRLCESQSYSFLARKKDVG